MVDVGEIGITESALDRSLRPITDRLNVHRKHIDRIDEDIRRGFQEQEKRDEVKLREISEFRHEQTERDSAQVERIARLEISVNDLTGLVSKFVVGIIGSGGFIVASAVAVILLRGSP